MKLKFWHGAVAGLVVAVFFLVDGCSANNQLIKEVKTIQDYKDTVSFERTEKGVLLAKNENLLVSKEGLLLAIDSLEGYLNDIGIKDPEVITIIKTELRVDTFNIPIYLTDCEFDTTFVVDSTHFKIDGRITNQGLTLNSLRFPNRMSLTIGYKKDKWWKRKERVATVTNTNPYIGVQGISSFTIKEDRKWYQKWWVKIGAGFIAGATVIILAK
jgi:hypothetical protein